MGADDVLTYEMFINKLKEQQKKIEAMGPALIAFVITKYVNGIYQCRAEKGIYFLADKASWREIELTAERVLPPADLSIGYVANFRGYPVIEDDELALKILKECADKWLRENEERFMFGNRTAFDHINLSS